MREFLLVFLMLLQNLRNSQINNLQTIVSDSLYVLETEIKRIQSTMEVDILKTKLEDFFTNSKSCLQISFNNP